MLLNHEEIAFIVGQGVILNAELDLINSSSIDITLGDDILVESGEPSDISLRDKEPLPSDRIVINKEVGYAIKPGQFILASSRQVFHLPLDISAEYKLKSSMARIGLQHLNAGWCDAGWNGSVLTMELINCSQHHNIIIRPGDRVGQMVFFKHKPVPLEKSYTKRGRYNGDRTVTGVKNV